MRGKRAKLIRRAVAYAAQQRYPTDWQSRFNQLYRAAKRLWTRGW